MKSNINSFQEIEKLVLLRARAKHPMPSYEEYQAKVKNIARLVGVRGMRGNLRMQFDKVLYSEELRKKEEAFAQRVLSSVIG